MDTNAISICGHKIEKTYNTVSQIFNFKQVEKLIVLLRQMFYTDYLMSITNAERNPATRVCNLLKEGLELYCEGIMVNDKCMQCFEESLPEIGRKAVSDIEAAFEGDPAADSYSEIIAAYPGPFAVMIQRVAHRLYELEVPIFPRIMTEYAHSMTGIDIHPGASIGEKFFIDHGTGVVIGETAVIGNHVKIYQGVTLGALSTSDGQKLKHVKRHPTVEDDVTIYAGPVRLQNRKRRRRRAGGSRMPCVSGVFR